MMENNLLSDHHTMERTASLQDTTVSKSDASEVVSLQDTVYVELGAGKGLLGLAVNCTNPQSTLVRVFVMSYYVCFRFLK